MLKIHKRNAVNLSETKNAGEKPGILFQMCKLIFQFNCLWKQDVIFKMHMDMQIIFKFL